MDQEQFKELRAWLKLIALNLAVLSAQAVRKEPLSEAEIGDVQDEVLNQIDDELNGPKIRTEWEIPSDRHST